MGQGSFGVIEILEHFTGFLTDSVAATLLPVGAEGVMYSCVGHTSHAKFSAVDTEPGGILKILVDSVDNDNMALRLGPFKPSDGGVVMEARFKVSDITTSAIFCGFQETLDASTPVMCAEYASDSFYYSASCGGFAGMQMDKDASTFDWRATAGDNQIPAFDCDDDDARAYNAPVNAKWDVVRVELDPNRDCRIYLTDDTKHLKLVKSGTGVMADTCMVYATVFIENRATDDTDLALYVDYIYARGYRDWTP